MRSVYTMVFEAENDGGYSVRIREVPTAISQGATKDQAEERIREALALVLDVEPSTFDLVEES